MKKKIATEPTEEALHIEALPDMRRGVYCNVASFKHTKNEFVLDFAFALEAEGQLVARIITSPRHAKGILKALSANVGKYEERFGPITEVEETPTRKIKKLT